MRKEVKLELATRLLNHGPLVLVSSMLGARVDVTPIAWNMPVSKKPPMVVLEIHEGHFIYECIMKTKDFAVNVPPAGMAEMVVKCGSVSGRDVDKPKAYGLELAPSRRIKSPALKGVLAVLECALVEDRHLLDEYNMVVGEVKYAEAEEKAFGEHWNFEDASFRTIHHLGNKTFCAPDGRIMYLR